VHNGEEFLINIQRSNELITLFLSNAKGLATLGRNKNILPLPVTRASQVKLSGAE